MLVFVIDSSFKVFIFSFSLDIECDTVWGAIEEEGFDADSEIIAVDILDLDAADASDVVDVFEAKLLVPLRARLFLNSFWWGTIFGMWPFLSRRKEVCKSRDETRME